MMEVKDVMTKDVVYVHDNEGIAKVIDIMKKRKISGLPVVNNSGKLIGVVTDGDIIRSLDIPDFPTSAVSPPPFDFIERLIKVKMEEWDVERALEMWKSGKVSDVMTKDPASVHMNDDVEKAADIMLEKNVHRLPVVDDDGKLVGIVTRLDLLKALR
uniref:CBS domain protein n=1 Tax=uncultured euryarchaeote Alv-FOS5 TaxID=337891 RepID=Q3SB86_9EURY|nr:CBS domain protein [uncultured euryarchaeote Alv-FOS5]